MHISLTSRRLALVLALVGVAGLSGMTGLLIAGPLTPPAGSITPSYKTLTEVEPRIPIGAATTPGDANCVYRITQPGSYYLTADVVGVAGKSGIFIAAADVTIDLQGFAVRGVAGSISGIRTIGQFDRLAIRDGVVSGWGGTGIDLGASSSNSALLERLRATDNGSWGIRSSMHSVLRDCYAAGNTNHGIVALNGSVVENCTATLNHESGLYGGTGAVFRDCVSEFNTGSGIELGLDGSAVGCSSQGNGATGIVGGHASTINRCVVIGNHGMGISLSDAAHVTNCNVYSNFADGISATNDCVITGNYCHTAGVGFNNDGAAIHLVGTDNRVEGNTCSDSDRGIDVDAAGNFIARNTCAGNFTNWTVVAGNVCLVVAATPGVAVNGNSGGTAPGSVDPNANFTY